MGNREEAIKSRLMNYYDNYKVWQSAKNQGVAVSDDPSYITFDIDNMTDFELNLVFNDLGGSDSDLAY